MAYQGVLDNCSDYNVYEADLEEAQAPLKPSIRPPTVEDWEKAQILWIYSGKGCSKYVQIFHTTWCLTTFFSPS